MEKTKPNILLSIVDEILRLQNCFESIFSSLQSLSGLTTLQKLVLSSVFDSIVSPTVPQIGRNLGRPRQVIQRAVNDLVKAGLLSKVTNPHHRRALLLEPTVAALELKQQAENLAVKTTKTLLGKINVERCDALKSELRDLRQVVEALTPSEGVNERPDAPILTVTGALALL